MAGIKRKGATENGTTPPAKKFKSNPSSKHTVNGKPQTKFIKGKQTKPVKTPKKNVNDSEEFGGFSEEERENGKKSVDGAMQRDGVTDKSKTIYAGLSGAEAHRKQKELKRERQAAKPNADVIQRAKRIWERLRVKTNLPKQEREALLQELAEIIQGRAKELVYKHDTVRIVQTAVKYGSTALRTQIAEELQGEYRSLAESKYAKFLVAKLIVEGEQSVKDSIIREFFGHVRKLINHPEASWIVDDIYRQVASPQQKAVMLREWYGPDFSIFKKDDEEDATPELADILKQSPEKRKPTMEYLHNMINQLVQKKLTGFTMLHDAMLQYYLNVAPGSSEANDFLKLVIGDKDEEEVDLIKNLAFTKSGSRVVCLALAHGTPRDRRQLLRSIKDTVSLMATDVHGYLVLLTALDVVDDTREVTSRILHPLIDVTKSSTPQDAQHEKILSLAAHPYGHIVLLYPLAGSAKWLLPLPAWTLLREIRPIRETTSKKAPLVRQHELASALLPSLLSTIASHADKLVQLGAFGCALIAETLLSPASSSSSGSGSGIDKTPALTAVANLAAGDPRLDGHIARSGAPAGKMLKALVAGGRFDRDSQRVVVQLQPELGFREMLWDMIADWAVQWASGPSSLVVVALLEADGFEGREELKRRLRAGREVLRRAADGEDGGDGDKDENTAGERDEARKVKKKPKSRKNENANGEGKGKGNAGARILLRLLDDESGGREAGGSE